MVLPPSVADDAPGPDTAGWLRRLKVALGLSRAGVLVLVDHAHPERLGELVRALLPVYPELEVYTEARKLAEVEPGSTLVLVPRGEDADWLNINRPIFASRALRVVLFCSRETSVALARGAVDFFDWISLRLECPAGPAPFAVSGLRWALAIRAPGIIWKGGDLDASFAAARPRRVLRRVSAARPYEEMVSEVRANPGIWVAWTEVDGDFRLRRVRWALAEARHRTRAILIDPEVHSPGWWVVHGQCAELEAARERLDQAGARYPGRLAGLVDLEPEAIELLSTLLMRGVDGGMLEVELIKSSDYGLAVSRLAFVYNIVSENDLVRGRAAPPVMRAFAAESRARIRLLQAAELDEVVQRISRGEKLSVEDAAWWSAWTRTAPSLEWFRGLEHSEDVTEVLLRSSQRTGETWAQVASVALATGDMDVAHVWAQLAAQTPPEHWEILVKVLEAQKRWVELESLLRRQLAASRQMPNVDRAWGLRELASVVGNRGRYAEAESLLRQLLAIKKSEVNAQHPDDDNDALLHELAIVLERQGKYSEAENLLRQSILVGEQALGMQRPGYATLLHTLASVLERQGKYAEAESLLRQSLTIKEQALGVQDPGYSASLHELAIVLERQGKYTEAESLLRQSLAVDEQVFGAQHPNYAASLHGLAAVLESQGKYAEAELLLRQSLDIKEQALSAKHPDYAASLHELANVLLRQGNYAEAELLLRQALVIQEQSFGLQHPDYASALQSLASVLERQGRYSQAEALLRQALAVDEKALGTQHPNYASALNELARILERQGKYAEAENLLCQSIHIKEQVLGIEHPEICMVLANLGFVLAKRKRPQEGETFLLRSADIASKTWGLHHPLTGQILNILAQIQSVLRKPEAVITARQAIDALLVSLGPEHPITKEILPRMRLIVRGGR